MPRVRNDLWCLGFGVVILGFCSSGLIISLINEVLIEKWLPKSFSKNNQSSVVKMTLPRAENNEGSNDIALDQINNPYFQLFWVLVPLIFDLDTLLLYSYSVGSIGSETLPPPPPKLATDRALTQFPNPWSTGMWLPGARFRLTAFFACTVDVSPPLARTKFCEFPSPLASAPRVLLKGYPVRSRISPKLRKIRLR